MRTNEVDCQNKLKQANTEKRAFVFGLENIRFDDNTAEMERTIIGNWNILPNYLVK
jgi:hypothetical protein